MTSRNAPVHIPDFQFFVSTDFFSPNCSACLALIVIECHPLSSINVPKNEDLEYIHVMVFSRSYIHMDICRYIHVMVWCPSSGCACLWMDVPPQSPDRLCPTTKPFTLNSGGPARVNSGGPANSGLLWYIGCMSFVVLSTKQRVHQWKPGLQASLMRVCVIVRSEVVCRALLVLTMSLLVGTGASQQC